MRTTKIKFNQVTYRKFNIYHHQKIWPKIYTLSFLYETVYKKLIIESWIIVHRMSAPI